jgi:hypothetical protein
VLLVAERRSLSICSQIHVLLFPMCRGKLNLGLLPSSSMRLTFSGDDGYSEQLALLNNDSEFSEAAIEEIPADISGRSFEIRFSQSKVHYYWCAEKSKDHGMELLMKVCTIFCVIVRHLLLFVICYKLYLFQI